MRLQVACVRGQAADVDHDRAGIVASRERHCGNDWLAVLQCAQRSDPAFAQKQTKDLDGLWMHGVILAPCPVAGAVAKIDTSDAKNTV